MTLDEAIKHAEEVADGHDRIKQIKAVTLEECKCADEHRQLAEWLKELKQLREQKPKSEWEQDHEILKAYSDGADNALSKIRDEVEEYKSRQPILAIGVADLEMGKQIALEYVLAIIDEYKEKESENKE